MRNWNASRDCTSPSLNFPPGLVDDLGIKEVTQMRFADNLKSRWEYVDRLVRRYRREVILALVFAGVFAIAIESFGSWIAERILHKYMAAVAVVETYSPDRKPVGQASGVFVKPDGTLVTTAHVLAKADPRLTEAKLPSGAFYKFKDTVCTDWASDVAAIRFDVHQPSFVDVSTADGIRVGERIYTVGAPLGLPETVSEGIVSHPERNLNGNTYVQFTAAISPGSSGSGLFNQVRLIEYLRGERGHLVGIVSGSVSGLKGDAQNVNVAVPAKVVASLLKKCSQSPIDGSAQDYYVQGFLASNGGRYEQAVTHFLKAVELNKNYLDAYMDLGSAYYELAQYDLQLKAFQKAVEIAPANADALYFLGTAYEDVGQFDLAVKAYKDTLEVSPDYKDALYRLGILYIIQGRRDEAAKLVPKVKKLDPGIGSELQMLLNRT